MSSRDEASSLDQIKEFAFDVTLSQREITYSNAQEAVYSPLARESDFSPPPSAS